MGGGVHVKESAFTLKGGRIQGGTDSDGFAKNTIYEDDEAGWWGMALEVYQGMAKWVRAAPTPKAKSTTIKAAQRLVAVIL
jgi:hypothetical protein